MKVFHHIRFTCTVHGCGKSITRQMTRLFVCGEGGRRGAALLRVLFDALDASRRALTVRGSWPGLAMGPLWARHARPGPSRPAVEAKKTFR